ncbi:MAG: hypothetical protein ACKKL5_00895 [Candidatus Komeilibacteria bacterium]
METLHWMIPPAHKTIAPTVRAIEKNVPCGHVGALKSSAWWVTAYADKYTVVIPIKNMRYLIFLPPLLNDHVLLSISVNWLLYSKLIKMSIARAKKFEKELIIRKLYRFFGNLF